jgi:hypothetical protein
MPPDFRFLDRRGAMHGFKEYQSSIQKIKKLFGGIFGLMLLSERYCWRD